MKAESKKPTLSNMHSGPDAVQKESLQIATHVAHRTTSDPKGR